MSSRPVRDRLAETDTRLLELFLGLYTLLWGAGFANPLTDTSAITGTSGSSGPHTVSVLDGLFKRAIAGQHRGQQHPMAVPSEPHGERPAVFSYGNVVTFPGVTQVPLDDGGA